MWGADGGGGGGGGGGWVERSYLSKITLKTQCLLAKHY